MKKSPKKPPKLLRAWQTMFANIFALRNRQLYSPADLLLHVVEETALISESLRKEDDNESLKAVARFFGWLLAFCTDQGIDFEKAIFSKYCAICPYCGRKRNCVCISEEKKPRHWAKNPQGKIPSSLDAWQRMFDRIYGRINKVAGREKVWLHVHEELGEISRAFRLKRVRELKEELADIFAWFIAFCNLSKINLGELVFSVYPGNCDVCGQKQCHCPLV